MGKVITSGVPLRDDSGRITQYKHFVDRGIEIKAFLSRAALS
jgi:hypothetical protein